MRLVRRLAIGLCVLVGLGTSLVVCGRVADRGRYAVPYSTHGAGPEGTRALFELAEARGLRPVRWAQDFARLPPRSIIVALGGCEVLMNRAVSRYEHETLKRWIDDGGTLVVAGASDYLGEKSPVRLARPTGCLPEESLVRQLARSERGEDRDEDGHEDRDEDGHEVEDLERALAVDPATTIATFAEDLPPGTPVFGVPNKGEMFEGLAAVPLVRPGRITTDANAQARTLLYHDGEPLAVVVRVGRGAIVVLASASVFQNQNLDSGDGAVVFARIVGASAVGAPVVFDEYHLGVGEHRSTMQYLRSVGATPFVIQLLVVVALLLIRRGRRFGAIRVEAEAPPGGTASYVGALGSLYQKSGDARAALERVVRHALGRIAVHHHVGAVEPGPLAKALDERSRIDEARAVRELGALVAESAVSASELVTRLSVVDVLLARAMGVSKEAGVAGGA